MLDGTPEVWGVESIGDNSVVVRIVARTQPGSQWGVGASSAGGSRPGSTPMESACPACRVAQPLGPAGARRCR